MVKKIQPTTVGPNRNKIKYIKESRIVGCRVGGPFWLVLQGTGRTVIDKEKKTYMK